MQFPQLKKYTDNINSSGFYLTNNNELINPEQTIYTNNFGYLSALDILLLVDDFTENQIIYLLKYNKNNCFRFHKYFLESYGYSKDINILSEKTLSFIINSFDYSLIQNNKLLLDTYLLHYPIISKNKNLKNLYKTFIEKSNLNYDFYQNNDYHFYYVVTYLKEGIFSFEDTLFLYNKIKDTNLFKEKMLYKGIENEYNHFLSMYEKNIINQLNLKTNDEQFNLKNKI